MNKLKNNTFRLMVDDFIDKLSDYDDVGYIYSKMKLSKKWEITEAYMICENINKDVAICLDTEIIIDSLIVHKIKIGSLISHIKIELIDEYEFEILKIIEAENCYRRLTSTDEIENYKYKLKINELEN